MIAFERIPPLAWIIVGIPLAIAGAIATGVVAWAAKDSYVAHRWVKARAEVQFADNLWLSDTRTRVSGSYRYEVGSDTYENDRLGISTFAAGLVDWWPQDMYDYLKMARDEKRPIMVWVDPEDPHRSVIDRELGAGILLVLLPLAFALDGAAFLAFRTAWRGLHGRYDREVIELLDEVRAVDNDEMLKAKWILTLIWIGAAWLIAINVLESVVADGKAYGYFVVVLPLLGVWFSWHCIVATYRARQ